MQNKYKCCSTYTYLTNTHIQRNIKYKYTKLCRKKNCFPDPFVYCLRGDCVFVYMGVCERNGQDTFVLLHFTIWALAENIKEKQYFTIRVYLRRAGWATANNRRYPLYTNFFMCMCSRQRISATIYEDRYIWPNKILSNNKIFRQMTDDVRVVAVWINLCTSKYEKKETFPIELK